jgi:hypothetical protein
MLSRVDSPYVLIFRINNFFRDALITHVDLPVLEYFPFSAIQIVNRSDGLDAVLHCTGPLDPA